MTETGDPLENAIAERINGILEQEYLECYQVENITQAKNLLTEVVKLYNEQRPHMSIGNMTSVDLHQNNQQTNKLWKTKSYNCKSVSALAQTVNPLQD